MGNKPNTGKLRKALVNVAMQHDCLTSPHVVELVEAAKEFTDDVYVSAAEFSRRRERVRAALAAFKGEK